MLFLFYLPINFNWLYAFIFLYIPMLAPYTKYPDGGGNGAGWFISALFLCYVLTPFIIKFIKKRNILVIAAWLTYICAVGVVLAPYFISPLQNLSGYKFPPVRLLHYTFGLTLGMMYVTNFCNLQNNGFIKKHPYIAECFVVLLLLISVFMQGDACNTIIGLPIILMVIIFLCNVKVGLLYKLFTNNVSQYLGNISFECYMIHYPLCILLSDKIKPYCSSLGSICFFYLLLLFLTIIFSLIYKQILIKFKI